MISEDTVVGIVTDTCTGQPAIRVQGYCPACHRRSLFLGNGGYVTCAMFDCSNPSAATDVLNQTAG